MKILTLEEHGSVSPNIMVEGMVFWADGIIVALVHEYNLYHDKMNKIFKLIIN